MTKDGARAYRLPPVCDDYSLDGVAMPPSQPLRGGDDIAAPFVFAYIGAVVVGIFAMLAWVFWFRGYA